MGSNDAGTGVTAAFPSTRERCIHDLFVERARRRPGEIAVRDGTRSWTYGEIDRWTNRLARVLQREGVTADDAVAICTGRSVEMVVSAIAVHKAGGGYAPLDPALPAERFSFMLSDCGSRLLLTQRAVWDAVPAKVARPIFVDDAAALAGVSDEPVASPVGPEHLAYLIYTSGSTGRPKGIEMTHRALVNMLDYQVAAFAARPDARTAQYSAFFFDVSFQDIFSTLAAGGTLVLVSEEMRRDFHRLARLLADEKVERIFVPVVALRELAAAVHDGGAFPRHLREVIVSGEQLRMTDAIRDLFDRLGPDSVLVNQYGPAETHVVTALPMRPPAHRWSALPCIGREIRWSHVYLLDDAMQPVPNGQPGEVYVGGATVARGYRARPDLTAERFLPEPGAREPGARMYRTGDLAVLGADGELQFRGRADFQVKIQGYRIEPEEVEAALAAAPGVKHAAVVARDAGAAGLQLVAFFVPDDAAEATPDRVRAFVEGRLPKYMVPSQLVVVDAIPLTPSGKLDRRALIDRAAERPRDVRPDLDQPFVAPSSPVEQTLAAVWEEILGLDRVGADDDFFDLGGHSLLAGRILALVKDRLHVSVSIQALFEASTVRRLAAVVGAAGGGK
jgi:amino acid adenylation domain-containing protein